MAKCYQEETGTVKPFPANKSVLLVLVLSNKCPKDSEPTTEWSFREFCSAWKCMKSGNSSSVPQRHTGTTEAVWLGFVTKHWHKQERWGHIKQLLRTAQFCGDYLLTILGSLCNSIHPPEMEINPLKTACGCQCGKTKTKKTSSHTCNPLTLENALHRVPPKIVQGWNTPTTKWRRQQRVKVKDQNLSMSS